jgi:hypothetical protein
LTSRGIRHSDANKGVRPGVGNQKTTYKFLAIIISAGAPYPKSDHDILVVSFELNAPLT